MTDEVFEILLCDLDNKDFSIVTHFINMLESENRKLRYERLMAKAAYFRDGGNVWVNSATHANYDEYVSRCDRIAEAYEARAMKIKEGL